MKAKINDKIICIPPYISATWDQISFLHTAEDGVQGPKIALIIHLTNGKVIKIQGLEPQLIDLIFLSHLQYLEKVEKGNKLIPQLLQGLPDQSIAFPIRFGIGTNEGIEMAFQHNPSQSGAPTLPSEVVEKIASIAKLITNGDLSQFPKPEPHCNCMHCQVARAIHNIEKEPEPKEEEAVTDEDLQFRSWEIFKIGDNLYSVTNPLDPHEKYNVFLGTPVGCTCGTCHCEHIKAVLHS